MTNKLTDYLIVGFVLVIFVGTFHLITQPLIALGETKSVTGGENIATRGMRFFFRE
ncbi:hypothetical protein MUP77_11535 [Candidatus Bathyarchaeota archaeon]|nr:hypothetical protein [Candidatus Bathyarchaeota archaeon]